MCVYRRIIHLYIYTYRRVKRKVKHFLSTVKREMCVDYGHITYRAQTTLCPVPPANRKHLMKICVLMVGSWINWGWSRVDLPLGGLQYLQMTPGLIFNTCLLNQIEKSNFKNDS